jgi:outer membrane protein TolC
MWKKKTKFFVVCFLWMSVYAADAQTVSLQQIINTALDKNYNLQIVRNNEQIAQNQNTPGNAGFLPSVGLRADQTWGVQNSEQQFFNGDTRSGNNARNARFDAFLEVDWVVFDGFRMFAHRDQLGYLQQMSEEDTKYYVEQTIADIATLYHQLIMERQMLESFRKSMDVSQFRLNLEKQKREMGLGNILQYHQALIDFHADSAATINQKVAINELQIQLNTLMNTKPDQSIIPDETGIALSGFDTFETLLQKAIENNRDLERSRLEELIAESAFRMERAARFPQISLFGNYSYANQTNEVGFIESSTAYGGQYGLRVRFNLYDGGKQNARIRNAAIVQQNAAISVQNVSALTESYLASLLNAYNGYKEQYGLLRKSLDASERSLSIARQQFEEGLIDGFDFRQTQLSSIMIENQIAGLLFAMKSIEIDIHRATGELYQHFL